MNSIQAFLAFLSESKVELWLDGEKLCCNGPKGTLTPSLKQTLVRRKKEIVQVLSNEDVTSGTHCLAIPSLPDRRELPLSFAQQRLFFIDQLTPGIPLYNITYAIHILGNLDLGALSRGINEIVRRHEILRTRFKVKDGQPVQIVEPYADIKTPILNMGTNAETDCKAEERRLVDKEARTPFDLGKESLIRAKILRVSEEEHTLVLTMHHIVSDGWSMGVLKRELSMLYNAFREDKPSPLPELPIQYGDFSEWQRRRLQGEILDAQLVYWKKQLADLPVLQMPTDFPRPAQQSFRGAQYNFELPVFLTNKLKHLGLQCHCSSFMTLLALFCVLLFRYTGQEDIVVGSPIAGRTRSELEGLIGFFVNTLVLRADLAGNPSFSELLAGVRDMALDAYDHQELPFEKLVAELRPEQDLSRNPLFQVVFALHNASSNDDLQLEKLAVSPMSVANETAKFDLTVSLLDSGEGLSGNIEYNTDLFVEATIERLVGHFQTLLEGIVENPDCPVSELPLLTVTERNQLLVEWNATKREFPKGACIHQLFEAQVERTPEAVAVVIEGRQLTYGELNAKANQLAHYLQRLGVGPEVMVGLCLNRSMEMIIGMLAILKAGGAYVPLDLSYPKDLLSFMLEDTQINVLLTQEKLLPNLPEYEGHILCLDSGLEILAKQSKKNPSQPAAADNLAYVMYTSGSTGRPKGVSVIHRGVVRLVKQTNYINVTKNDVFLHFAPISFDASTFEIWGALLNGARLVLFPGQQAALHELGDVIRRHSVTTLWLTAGLFHVMVENHIEGLRPVKYLLTGGDVISPRHARKVLTSLKGCRLINGYGPTENTTFTCCHIMTSQSQVGGTVSIGRPISNTQVFILDNHMQPAPVGVPGELYIGGDGLARGYLNRSELTAEKFISNPFSEDSEARLYRSGDLARYRYDGTIEFLGRKDHQVKIRGFRVELGEIESVLLKHPAIREAVVVALEGDLGEKCLVAYIVTNREREISTTELQRFLRAKLPIYMIPYAFMFLHRLPMTPSGKVDKRSLPPLVGSKERVGEKYEPPRNNKEAQLAMIWEDVLGARPIGINEDFFDLGGHSLLAMELVDRIEKIFHRTITVATLFQHPTIELLAEVLDTKGWSVPWNLIIPIRPSGSRLPFFCIHGKMTDLARYVDRDIPIFAIAPHGFDGKRAPTDVEKMTREYLKQIRAIQPKGPYHLGGYSFGGILAIEVARLLKKQGQKISLLVLLDPTDLKRNRNTVETQIASTNTETRNKNSNSIKMQFERIFRYLNRVVNDFSSKRGLKEKSIYLFKGVTSRIDRRFKVKTKTKQIICEFYLRSGNRIPSALRRFYHSQASYKALRTYVPKIFPDNVVIFHSKNRTVDFQLYWKRLIGGNVEFHELPGDHFDILDEPYVQVLAEKLSLVFEKALEIDEEQLGKS